MWPPRPLCPPVSPSLTSNYTAAHVILFLAWLSPMVSSWRQKRKTRFLNRPLSVKGWGLCYRYTESWKHFWTVIFTTIINFRAKKAFSLSLLVSEKKDKAYKVRKLHQGVVAPRFECLLEARLAPKKGRVRSAAANRSTPFQSTALLLVESRCSCKNDDMDTA